MDSHSPTNHPQISMEVPPYLRVYSDGTVERFAGTQVTPPGLDPQTNVLSKDIIIQPHTHLTARLYRPNNTPPHTKLPLLIYFHGGAFCISSPADPLYHNSLNRLVSQANVVAFSVDYRLAPEHPLPTAYQDSWDAVQWVASHAFQHNNQQEHDTWLTESVDFDRVFLAGDSAGANIAHFIATKLHNSSDSNNKMRFFEISGLIMIHPYFWGKEAIGVEASDPERKKMVDKWWELVCPSEKGNDDPLINPFVEEAPGLECVVCRNVLVIVAERDILKERGKLYHKSLVNNGAWKGKAELYEAEGEDHDFHIFNPDSDNANNLLKRIAAFINNQDY